MSVIGGIASIWGAPFGVAVALILKELIRTRMHALLRGAGGEHEVIAFGVLVVIIMLFLPDGLTVGAVEHIKQWRQRALRAQQTQRAQQTRRMQTVKEEEQGG
jgi:branched-chain amino acid transport system permease protein